MSDKEPLPPLSDDLSALVRRAHEDKGSSREVAELHHRVDRALGPHGGGPGGSAPGWVFPLLAAALVVLGFVGFQGMIATSTPAAEPMRGLPDSSDESGAARSTPISLVEASEREAPAAEHATQAFAPTSETHHEPRRVVSSRERHRVRESPEPEVEMPTSEVTRDSVTSLSDPREETRLLDRARSLLRNDAAAALELAREHERRFPRGLLVQEREVIAIDALLRTGRRPYAHQRAARFRERFPTSALGHRVDTLFSHDLEEAR